MILPEAISEIFITLHDAPWSVTFGDCSLQVGDFFQNGTVDSDYRSLDNDDFGPTYLGVALFSYPVSYQQKTTAEQLRVN